MSSPAMPLERREEGLPTTSGGWVRLLRHALLAGGFLVVIGVGLARIASEDAGGLALLIGGVAGLVFLPTRTITTLVWLVVLADGTLGLLGSFRPQLFEAVAGALGALVSLAPLPKASPTQPSVQGSEPVTATVARLTIRTIGRLELNGPEGELTTTLRRLPSQSFIWLFLLIRTALGDKVTSRQLLGDEFSPVIDPEEQRSRLRKRLSDMARDLPAPLSDCLLVDRRNVTFGLDGCDFDVARLFELRLKAKAAAPLLPAELATEVEEELTAVGFGLVLPEWEQIAEAQTEGRGSSSDLIQRLRREVDDARSDLVLAIADTRQASGQLGEAIPLLRSALERSPEREDLARRLINAYMATNQTDLAAKVGRSYQISEVH